MNFVIVLGVSDGGVVLEAAAGHVLTMANHGGELVLAGSFAYDEPVEKGKQSWERGQWAE